MDLNGRMEVEITLQFGMVFRNSKQFKKRKISFKSDFFNLNSA